MKLIILFIFANLVISCATTHPGQIANQLTSHNFPIKVSARTIENRAIDTFKESFQLIEVTFENTSEAWFKIHSNHILIDDPANSHLSVVLGNDLASWANAMKFQMKKDQYNEELALGTLSAAASVAILSSNNRNSSAFALGSIALAGTSIWAVSDALVASYDSATQVEKIPENHLYKACSIPARMFVRRWVLLNKKSNTRINNLAFELETIEGEKETYFVKM
jgi:hypothetical protein